MKKLITVILALLYIGTSTGAPLNMHYCMGKLADWGLGHNKSRTCSQCGMDKSEEKNNGCCKDEHKFIKNTTDQKAAELSFQVITTIAVALLSEYFEVPSLKMASVTEDYPVSNAPPRSSRVATYIFNRTFLI